MTDDPYEALGVARSADAAAIKKAYRKIARADHPDFNPDDPAAEARFKAASSAYDLLKDPETRRRFDAGEIDASGQERAPRGYYRDAAGGAGDTYSRAGFGGGGFGGGRGEQIDPEEFFARFGGARAGRSPFDDLTGGRFDMPGRDARYVLDVALLDALRGTKTRITLPGGGDLSVTIPEGATDGMTLRLRGKGGPGHGEGPPGDAYVTLRVADDPVFSREGDDIRTVLPITLGTAVLGGKVAAPTIDGEVRLTVPEGASSGRVLRLRGRGAKGRGGKRGDHLVELRIVMPPEIDDDLRAFMTTWAEAHPYDPAAGRGRS